MDKDKDPISAELEARRRAGAVLERIGGLKQVASLLSGGGVPRPIRTLLEQAYAANEHLRPQVLFSGQREMGERFASMTAADWRRTIETLLPHIAPSVKSASIALAMRPYQHGLARKPFRAPRSPQTLAALRGGWLMRLTLLLGEYDADIRWIAERGAHIAGWSGGADLGWLLAGAIDIGDDTGKAVQEILVASAKGEHETGRMGHHVTRALLSCSRPDAWEFVEKLLLAAQREEGLRQAILESVDESHPQAFRRLLRLILDENLTRFSSVVRAADTWFGFAWDGASGVALEPMLQKVLLFLRDPSARAAALDESDAETVYLALWSIAFDDVDAAIAPAAKLLSASAAEVRFVATHFLVQATWTSALPHLVKALGDADLRVAMRALDMFGVDQTSAVDGQELFAQLEAMIARLPKRVQSLDALVWPWWTRKLERSHIASALAANVSAVSGERFLPYVQDLDPYARARFVRTTAGLRDRWGQRTKTVERRTPSRAERAVIMELLGDTSADVRAAAFEAMATVPLESDEVERLIDLLGRKPGDLRNGAIVRLRTLRDAELLAAADRLIADSSDLRRLAGLELLRDAWEAKRATSEVHSRVARFSQDRETLTDPERVHVTAVLGERTEIATANDALGLLAGESLPTWPAPQSRRVVVESDGAKASLESLAQLVLANQATEVRRASGETGLLLESAHWGFGPQNRDNLVSGKSSLPLADVWRGWLRERPAALRDRDDLEMLRALVADADSAPWKSSSVQKVIGLWKWSAGTYLLRGLCEWCVAWEPPAGGVEFLLDGLENSIAALDRDDYRAMEEERKSSGDFHLHYYRPGSKEPAFHSRLRRADGWLTRVRWWRKLFPASVQPAQAARLYAILRAFEARSGGFKVLRIQLEEFLGAYHAGAVPASELVDLLVGRWSNQGFQSLLRAVSARKPLAELVEHPELLALVDRCRRRVVEVETQRGDRKTAASDFAMALRWTGGLETIARAVPALGKSHFTRSFGWSYSGASRQDTLSHLVIRSIPREEDTPEAFATWARDARVKEARLVELAVYAPQWAAHVNHVLQWPGLEGAVWWIHAHTKDDRSWQLPEMKEIWAAEVSERTPLSAADLTEGAVDVAWFASVYAELGAERWKRVDTAAKYAASSGGHARAQLFARAMNGMVSRDDVIARIDGSRHKDSVRALGLVPLAEGTAREKDLLERYMRLEEFRRQARKFGSQRQQSETRAVAIGLANLARTAGYRDSQRLQWAMEQRAVADLARGPVVLERGGVALTLSVDADGVPALAIEKNGKPLKSLPAALKKDADVAELKHRLQELKRQRSRVRDSLEEAMCRGDKFSAEELRALLEHPILAPAISRIVLVGDGVAGYLAEGGRVLRDHTGAQHALGNGEELRVAHPHDLLARGDWSAWQSECFRAERIQPFKQIFRELYPITETERGTQLTRRYAGHQVNPRQALALLGGRGWVARPEEGVSRTFHDEGLTARLGFQEAFYTPADIEGLTLEDVIFTRKGEWKQLTLDEVPPRLFSETMRDLDLVVSVAHRGGVDPEATASTVEMRAALVRETCELLGIPNVELAKHHAIIRGALGEYSVHLGSAGVMLLPGTSLPIVAVHSQHRGRLFLPFADDDPRTAEVLSKVLLLARDKEIRDPNIMQWITAGTTGSGL
ncbi:MAG TPA: DUF5724 domain-containing protein [Gemmatimonadaceae bacterium]|nr:DUF5724 domain-containing protein [Gemmatimonadaceae bacterium]